MNATTISTPKAFRFTSSLGLLLGVLTVLIASLAYAIVQPGFSIFNTYLSDIGDTPGWPQIVFNSGTLLAVPLRYAVLILVVLRLRGFRERNGTFEAIFLTLGALTTFGTVLMTAVPFSVAPAVHKSGIGLYFLGVVFLQTMLGVRQLSMKGLPRVLPALSFSIVASYLIFFILLILYESGIVGRTTPVFWEWMCFFTSMLWLLGHGIVLGKEDAGDQG